MASKDCYHFTKLNRAYQIEKKGLEPRIEGNSKAINDNDPKISFSDGKIATAGLFANFYDVYMAMNEGKRNPTDKKVISSKNIEDYLGEGIYLMFDGTNIENTGGNKGHINPFDAATTKSIPPEALKVCVLRDNSGNIHYSQYDYIKYIIANLTGEDYSQLQQMDKDNIILKCIEEYKKNYKDELEHFSQDEYTPESMTLADFCKTYKAEIDTNIIKYLQTHFVDSQGEISKLNKEFENMPSSITNALSQCQIQYKKMMEELINGNLPDIKIPIPDFYDLYRNNLDNVIGEYCNQIVETSKNEITELRQDVDNMTEYDNLFLHSKHHIKNVVEFAYIIGKSENSLDDDFNLLIQAAKYHDSGRETSEWLSDNHADPSAKHAEVELSKTGKYTPEQIAMIKVAIRYHEHSEKFKNEFDEKYFMEVAETEGVPENKLEHTKLMCIYLKDADALDRVILGNLDKSYLRTSIAKSDIFLREYGKDKNNISWENAGLAVKLNKDFNIEQELLNALQKLKEDYSEKETLISAIENIENHENSKVAEGKSRNIFGMIKKVRHVLQTQETLELNKQDNSKSIQELVQESIQGVPNLTTLDEIEQVKGRQERQLEEQKERQNK